jgi:hypothetical protein
LVGVSKQKCPTHLEAADVRVKLAVENVHRIRQILRGNVAEKDEFVWPVDILRRRKTMITDGIFTQSGGGILVDLA